jgi:hypothetical protein
MIGAGSKTIFPAGPKPSAAWSSSGFQMENIRSEPNRDKGNRSPKTPRQFKQHFRGVGWIMARTLPPNKRTVKTLLQKGRIEQQHQGPKRGLPSLTDKGFEAKKSPIPIGGA